MGWGIDFIKNVTAETPVFRHGEEPTLPPLFTFNKNYDIILLMKQYVFQKRRFKAIPRRENRWMSDVTHQISKTLVRKEVGASTSWNE